jgi:hypothetical protein
LPFILLPFEDFTKKEKLITFAKSIVIIYRPPIQYLATAKGRIKQVLPNLQSFKAQ